MREGEVGVNKIRSFLEKEKNKTRDEQFIKDKLALANPMDKIQILSQRLGGVEKWNLNIAYLKVENQTVQIRGSLSKSSLKRFQSQLETLAKGSLKEEALPEEKEKIEQLKSLPEKKSPSPSLSLNGKKNQKDKKEKGKSKKGGLTQKQQVLEEREEERTFFSYTFELKEGV